jgi:hypothetical protein
MPRGGKREGAGGKPTWKNGKTKTIRVPIALADEILRFAKELDVNGFIDADTESKVINLSGISVAQIKGKSFVFLGDLVRVGYEIKPDKLAEKVILEIYKDEIKRGGKN